MTINWQAFMLTALLGALVEFWTLKSPNIYQKTVSTGKVITIAACIALLPQALVGGAIIGLGIARFGDLLAYAIYALVVKVAVWLEVRQWDIEQNQTEEEPENLTRT